MSPYLYLDINALASRWWTLVARGIAALLFGILALAAPGLSLLALVILWGVYAFADGVLGFVLAYRGRQQGRRWGWLLVEGVTGIGVAVLTFVWPGITALVLLTLIAVWAVFTGVAEIAAAVELRHEIRGEWLLGASGVLSILFGLLLLVFPGAGALALVWLIGLYAIIFGGLMLGLGLRLHRIARAGARPLQPTHA